MVVFTLALAGFTLEIGIAALGWTRCCMELIDARIEGEETCSRSGRWMGMWLEMLVNVAVDLRLFTYRLKRRCSDSGSEEYNHVRPRTSFMNES